MWPSPFINASTIHIFVFPFPAQGHMLPLLDLTHELALKGHQITILVTPKNLPTLNSLLSLHPNSMHTLLLPFPTHTNLPSGVENVKDIGNAGNVPIISSLRKLEAQVIQWFKSHPTPPHAILSDFFLGFTNTWAQQLNVPRIAFFSSGVFLSIALDYLLQDAEALSNLERVDFPTLPGSPSFVRDHLPSIFKRFKPDDPDQTAVKDDMLENFKSWGLVFNSFHGLEGEYLSYLKEKVCHNRVYCIGPLNSPVKGRANPVHGTENSVLTWLDKCTEESVVYVCFGSQKLLTKSQMEGLALGLERSGTRFVWVVKAEASSLIPDGFEERVVNQGLVIRGWAPQVEILNHKAVGAFVSHCGWNSILESIMAGVLVLGWPMEADQYMNARLLVESMGSAICLCEGEDTVPDPDELGRVIGESVGNDIPQKARAKFVRHLAFEAVEVGGSSLNDLHELMQELIKLDCTKR